MNLYGIKNCDTVRKARKWLEARGTDYRFVDLRADGVSEAQIKGWVDQAGLDLVLNKRGTTWRKLDDAQKAETNTAKLIKLMAAEPTLIKRPIIEADEQVLVGFTKDVEQALTALGN